mmetsp:Transcript_47478/g.112900  ORF Transcript_47478/g.112900 Transcript_47478/m.112900 type:complete len:255 (+) Transcript_47478:1021-1785(+)
MALHEAGQLAMNIVDICASNLNERLVGCSSHDVSRRNGTKLHHQKRAAGQAFTLGAHELDLMLSDEAIAVLLLIGKCEAAAVAGCQLPAPAAHEGGQFERAPPQVVAKAIPEVKVRRCPVLAIAVLGIEHLEDAVPVLRAAPLVAEELMHRRRGRRCVLNAADLDVPDIAKLHQQVVAVLVRKVVIAENDLLLSLVAQAPEVARIASNHLPVATLAEKVHEVHGTEAHVVLTFGASFLECAAAIFAIAELKVRR